MDQNTTCFFGGGKMPSFVIFTISRLTWRGLGMPLIRFASEPRRHSTSLGCLSGKRHFMPWRSDTPSVDDVQCSRLLVGSCCFFLLPRSDDWIWNTFVETNVPLVEGTPVPKFVFTSSLAVFGETYVEAGTPVGYVLQLFWCLPLFEHVGHQVDVVTSIFLFRSSCDCFLQVILTRLCQKTHMAWRKLVASCWSMTTQGHRFWFLRTRSTEPSEIGRLLFNYLYDYMFVIILYILSCFCFSLNSEERLRWWTNCTAPYGGGATWAAQCCYDQLLFRLRWAADFQNWRSVILPPTENTARSRAKGVFVRYCSRIYSMSSSLLESREAGRRGCTR